jgi:menaquinone-specific isochorismate synthase
MQNILSSTINNLSKFISSSRRKNDGRLFSYAFKLNIPDQLQLLNRLESLYSKMIFFRQPNRKHSFIALGSVTDLIPEGETRISTIAKNFDKWKNELINNWDDLDLNYVPVIVSAVKFDEKRNSKKWIDFPPLTFYVPEIILLRSEEESYCIFNFIFKDEKQVKTILRDFKEKLRSIINSNGKIEYSPVLTSKDVLNDSIDEKAGWNKLVDKAKDIIRNNQLEKLVLSRQKIFSVSNHPDWNFIFEKLEKKFPKCYLFLNKSKNSYFFGVSPEKFISVYNGKIEVEAVAGSAPRSKQQSDDMSYENGLLVSTKNLKEHKYVSEFIINVLKEYSINITSSDNPEIKKLDNIQHLITKVSAEIKIKDKLFELIEDLYPTPAVCGVPKNDAIEYIRQLESYDRGLYSGLIGWLDFNGNCDFSVTIRSALVKSKEITAYAGAGIVEDSDPDEEFIETQLKLKPILMLFNEEDKSK